VVVRGSASPRVGRGVALGRLYSPGSMAAACWRSTGLRPPLVQFPVPDDRSLGHWIEAAHGGWVTAEVTGSLVPVIDADIHSAYPAAWCLAGWWDVVRAASLREIDVRLEVRSMCRRAAEGDLGIVLEAANYPTFGRTLCAVRPAGEPWPTERPRPGGARLVLALVAGDELYVTAADVVAAAYLSCHVPDVLSAVRLDPVGREEAQPVPLRDEVVVPAGHDPIPDLIRLRPPKGHDERLRAVIRVVGNAAAWGLFARLDPVRVNGRLVERPGTWTWPPVAACVPALARLWLAAVERAVSDRGGAVVARDTDGIAVIALPVGGSVTLPDGRTVLALAWTDLEELLAAFDVLDPFGDGASFWSIERATADRPLHLLALAPKRYVMAMPAGDGWEVVGGTEHALGGGLVDPPTMVGRGPDRRHTWIKPVAVHAVELSAGESTGFRAPWDVGHERPFPALARWSAGSPAALARIPAALGAHAFSPLVEARVDRLLAPGAATPVALDPADDLAGWAEVRWIDPNGRNVAISTGADPGTSVPLARLADVAADWSVPVAPRDPGLLTFDRRLVRRVGRGGALIDARLANPDAGAEDHQARYPGGDAAGYVGDLAASMGKHAFARRFSLPLKTAERLARGGRPSPRTLHRVLSALGREGPAPAHCALEGCDLPVVRPNARYCSKSHADRAYRARKAATGTRLRGNRRSQRPDPDLGVPVCRRCGALMLGDADGGNGLCIDCTDEGVP